MASSPKKRSRNEPDESRAECPFKIKLVDPREKEPKSKKRRKQVEPPPPVADDDESKKNLTQLSPFAPTGKFRTHDTMDLHYQIEPGRQWSEMTRYNSFVLNGVKYFSEGFIYVANESSIDRAKAPPSNSQGGLKKSDDDWVARILEIRASDEHHVYARVYWMYWPDELPAHTLDGKKAVQGRQPYHGQMELIASNHMDMINVVSVTSQAQVNQMIEDNDDDIQSSLYWRQAFDVRTYELSSVERVCKCGQPANPDKTLIGCSNTKGDCGKWLHSDCLLHDALMKVYQRLGKTKPHVPPAPLKDEKDGDEAKRPLSPKESGGAVSAQQSIDVKSDCGGMAIRGIKPEILSATRLEPSTAPATSTEPESKPMKKPVSAEPASSNRRTAGTGRKYKGKKKTEAPPIYDGLFEARTVMTLTPPMIEITDLRRGVEGGAKVWLEPMLCLICHERIV